MADKTDTAPDTERQPVTRDEIQARLASVREVWFRTRGIQPPVSLYIQRDDSIVLQFASTAPVTVNIQVRLLRLDGTIVPMVFTANSATVAFPNTVKTLIQAVEGFILSVQAQVDASQIGPVQRGQAYVYLTLNRGSLAAPLRTHVLLAGYLEGLSVLSYPNAVPLSSIVGPGNVSLIPLANPGAGADPPAEVVPVGIRWRLVSVTARLQASAAVATREPILSINDASGNTVSAHAVATGVTANQAIVFTWFGGATQYVAAVNDRVHVPIPQPCNLKAGMQVAINTVSLQAADQWTAIQFCFEEWIQL